jgi:SprT protein
METSVLQANLLEQKEIEPIDSLQRQQVEQHTVHFIRSAEEIFKQKFPQLPVHFDLSGRTAGMYKVVGRRGCIRYNPWIFGKYFEENLSGTVPHEVAHFVVDQVYGLHRVKPHGLEWQAVMAEFGADAGVTFDLNLDGIPQRRQTRHRYQCPCQTHDVSSTRHNRVQRRNSAYYCVRCRGKLVYTP